jgi:hypothetical protein
MVHKYQHGNQPMHRNLDIAKPMANRAYRAELALCYYLNKHRIESFSNPTIIVCCEGRRLDSSAFDCYCNSSSAFTAEA